MEMTDTQYELCTTRFRAEDRLLGLKKLNAPSTFIKGQEDTIVSVLKRCEEQGITDEAYAEFTEEYFPVYISGILENSIQENCAVWEEHLDKFDADLDDDRSESAEDNKEPINLHPPCYIELGGCQLDCPCFRDINEE